MLLYITSNGVFKYNAVVLLFYSVISICSDFILPLCYILEATFHSTPQKNSY